MVLVMKPVTTIPADYRPVDWREARRLRAYELQQQGWSQKTIAQALGVTPGAVCQWLSRAREGWQKLRHRVPPGRPSRLSTSQRAQLPPLLQRGAEAFGFRGDFWTRARVAQVIFEQWGVSYHEVHVGRLLKQLGWSRQKPVTRATQRDEEAIEEWKHKTWPRLKKKPRKKDVF